MPNDFFYYDLYLKVSHNMFFNFDFHLLVIETKHMGGGGNGSFIAKETAGNKFSDCRAKIPGREISGRVGCCVGRKPNGDLCVFAMVSYTYRLFQQNCVFLFIMHCLTFLGIVIACVRY